MKKHLKFGGLLALGLALLIFLIVSCAPEEAEPRSYSCNVYTEQGCAKFVVASGGEIEIQSGGTFDLQSGATVDFSGGVDLDGSTLTMDADGDTTMVASSDDIITATISDTAGYLVVHIGNLKVGNGSPTTSQDGEDAYVEGGLEVDGTVRFDGALDANSTADIAGNISSSDGAITVTDNILIDGAANANQLTVQGYTTQTNSLLVLEQSDGTDVLTVSNAGNLDVDGTFNYGADDITPISYDGTTQYEAYFSSASSVTNTTVTSATHNMTTAVDWAICYVSDPDDDAGDPFLCVPTISGTSVTFQALQDDGDNATTAATKLYYYIIGR